MKRNTRSILSALPRFMSSIFGMQKSEPVRKERHTYIKGRRHNYSFMNGDRVIQGDDRGTIFRIRNGVAHVRWDKQERRHNGCMVLVSDIARA